MGDEATYRAVCCFRGEHYYWFDLPRPMTRAEADEWAWATLGTPVEAYRRGDRGEVKAR